MRITSRHLLFSSALAIAACTAGDVDDAPDRSDDAATASDGGHSSTTGSDAGGSANHGGDAAAHDAATTTSTSDAGHHTAADAGTPPGGNPGDDAGVVTSTGETGRMVGMTAAHNAVRAKVQTSPMLADMVWDPTVAAYAQQWADQLAASQATCDAPMHRSSSDLQKTGYGENLAEYGGYPSIHSTAQQAVNSWASEVACWTYGTISSPQHPGTEKCDVTCYKNMRSDGCGHYTQVVWRDSTKLGCGVATCTSSMGYQTDIWICNYSPAGNYVGKTPY